MATKTRRHTLTLLLTLVVSSTTGSQSGDDRGQRIVSLERAVAARPADVESRRILAEEYSASGRFTDAVAQLRKVTELAPNLPGGWYALGHAYNAIKQEAIGAFDTRPEDSSWRQLLGADALLANGRLIDAFTVYREVLERLPSMVSAHDSVSRIYEQTGHAEWAARERAIGTRSAIDCVARKALCEFRAGRYRSALTDALAQPDSAVAVEHRAG